MSRHGIRGATDVTGFGLLGHGLEMARASGARLVFDAAALPALDGALDLARAGIETGGAGHNRRFTAPALRVAPGVAAELVALAHDPQTSGGLLAAVPRRRTSRRSKRTSRPPAWSAWRVGTVEDVEERRPRATELPGCQRAGAARPGACHAARYSASARSASARIRSSSAIVSSGSGSTIGPPGSPPPSPAPARTCSAAPACSHAS